MTKLEEIIKQHAEGINRTPTEFLEVVHQLNLRYDSSGNFCNLVGGKLVPAESQAGALSLVYHRIREEVKSANRPVFSGTTDIPDGDGGPTQLIPKVIVSEPVTPPADERVAVPILPKEDYLKPLAQEFQRTPRELEEVLRKGGYFVLKGKGLCRNLAPPGSEEVTAWLGVTEGEVKDFLRKYYAPPVPVVGVPLAQEAAAPISQPSASASLEETIDIDADAVAEDAPNPKRKYFDLLTSASGRSDDEIETALGKKGYGLNLSNGQFYRLPPEPDGELGGEEVSLSEVNDALGDYFAPERVLRTEDTPAEELKNAAYTSPVPSAPVSQPEPAAPDSSRATIPEMQAVLPPVPTKASDAANGNYNGFKKGWFAKGDAVPEPEPNDELEPATPVKPEDILKRPWQSYVISGVGILALAAAVYVMGYFTGRTVGSPSSTTTKQMRETSLTESFSAQIGDLEAELDTARTDNYTCVDNKNIVEANYGSCTKELGETKAALEQKGVAYSALEQQLAAAPDAQEVLALKDTIAVLETVRNAAWAERDGTIAELGECLIAASTPSIEYVEKPVERVVEKVVEVPIEVEKIVEKEVVKYVEKECPEAKCPAVDVEAPVQLVEEQCLRDYSSLEAVNAELWEGITLVYAERDECRQALDYSAAPNCDVQVKSLGEKVAGLESEAKDCDSMNKKISGDYDTCVADRNRLQQQVNSTTVSVSDPRYTTIKEIIQSSAAEEDKAQQLGAVVNSYLKQKKAVKADGSTCAEGLGSLYEMMVSVHDDATKGEFVRILDAFNPCGTVPKGTDYIRFK